ncbi:CopG family transcriptional regulator [Clostridioides difficile]|nr:ribbon-helix-helix, copG family protein [Clostridioides difficile]EQI00256.1 ribbon-helix-helix, copG family protein [Clostridioides difficile F314]EGT5445815.1 CopG family transcriptional regulator [Clostridioides difficile]EII6833621.1 CopG family transcriptional regulator [Clostridioides difficile]EIJ0739182.1 CopG family transcriptional regulator [Clostridioides difficile]MBF4708232.1 CopG family transcriptional regulator [Clostridioides difficile]
METAMNKRITVRLDSKHEEILETYTKKYGITKNEAVRKGIEKLEEKE